LEPHDFKGKVRSFIVIAHVDIKFTRKEENKNILFALQKNIYFRPTSFYGEG
jgi:hypothetical protein